MDYEGVFENNSNVLQKNLTDNELNDIEDKTCTICLENLSSTKLTSIMPCNHTFHDECLKEYIKFNKKCPNCRKICCI